MKKLLVIADSPTCNTGFGTVTRNILDNLPSGFDIAILGVNYYGDPHPAQKKYRIYSPAVGQDVYGFGRIPRILAQEQPDVIWILNDIWLCAEYVLVIRRSHKTIPIVIYTPIDSEHIKAEFVAPLADPFVTLITYTDFAKQEIIKAGYQRPIHVIPHGVDLGNFYPVNRLEARNMIYANSPLASQDPFIVLYVARN